MVSRPPWTVICVIMACAPTAPPSSSPPPRWIDSDEKLEPPPCAAPSPSDTLWQEADLDAPLQLLAIQRPKYPPSLEAQGQAGYVKWELTLTPNGRPDPCSLSRQYASHSGFVEPSRASILSAQYAPPMRHGVPVSVRITRTLRFSIVVESRVE
jgi:outer membrane biosynthesis protein TonB